MPRMSAPSGRLMPLAVDLCCGVGGWAEGLLAEGWDVVGFDIERHRYGAHAYPAQLVLQDVLTLHGSQFRDAGLIVASPPCQKYSYMAMPWSRAKAKAAAIRADGTGRMLADLNRLFDACFRIQAQASLAAGRHIPMVVENVRGAQPWVGRARGNFGSFYLWGDVPGSSTQLNLLGNPPTVERVRLMPFAAAAKNPGGGSFDRTRPSSWHENRKSSDSNGDWFAAKVPGFRFDGSGRSFQSASVEGTKISKDWFGGYGGGFGWDCSPMRRNSSKSSARKAASALIAKIPEPLARHVARSFHAEV